MRVPDVTGPFGKAWLLPPPGEDKPEKKAGLAQWLINVPGAHPHWEYWYVAMISLADMEGVPPAHKKYPEAEFEFLIASINPEDCPAPSPDETGHFPFLTPMDVVEQFHGVSARDAVRICEGAIQAIVNGRISPDQDFRPMWTRLITGTVQHYREGGHPEN